MNGHSGFTEAMIHDISVSMYLWPAIICSYLENRVVKIEKSEPQTRVAISTEGPRGA